MKYSLSRKPAKIWFVFGVASLFLFFGFVFSAPTVFAEASFVASNGQTVSTANSNSVSFTTTRNINIGEHVVCSVSNRVGSGLTLTSVSAGSLSLAADLNYTGGSDAAISLHVWSARATSQILSGSTVTATFSAATISKAISCFSLSGVATASYVRATSTGNATSAVANSGNTNTTPLIGDIAIGSVIQREGSSVITVGTGYTFVAAQQTEGAVGQRHATEYKILNANGATSADFSWTGDRAWKAVVVVYAGVAVPSVSLDGTITDSTTDQDIIDGGKTITLTLENDEWVAAGASFDAQRQGIINGITAASSPSNGWNNVVIPEIAVTDVIRTSNTVVTITLPEIPDYSTHSTETITAIIPSAALTVSSDPITAEPNFTVSRDGGSIFHVLDGANGDNSGSDWSNALPDLPASLERGATYFIGDGSYSSYDFNDAASGSSLITIKKATADSHGFDEGWSSLYGDGTAAWGSITFDTSYWIFDGITGGGPNAWTSGHGFTFNNAACTTGSFVTLTSGISNIIVRHVEFSQTGNVDSCSPASLSTHAIVNTNILNNSTLEYLYVHNISGLPFFLRNGSTNIIQYNYLGHICGQYISDVGEHCEGLVLHDMDDLHFRYNYLAESPSSGGFVKNSAQTADSIRIYGNVFRNGSPIACNTGSCTSWRVFNNTFASDITAGPISGDGTRTSLLVYNNISYDASVQTPTATHDYNWYSAITSMSCNMDVAVHENLTDLSPGSCDLSSETANPFINILGTTPESLRLTAPISGHAGLDVCTLDACTGEKHYDVDAFGITRGLGGIWDRGAYEYVADTTAPTVTAFSIPSTSSSLTVSISTFTATDDIAVTGYKFTESSTAPLSGDSDWSSTAPTTYTFSSSGSKTLYAWAKDAAGNVSTNLNAPVTITLPTTSTGGGGGGFSAPYPKAPTGGFTATRDTTNSQNKTVLHFGFGSDITSIAISENLNFAPASYINATNSIEWPVTTTKILYVKYCNKYGRCSNPISLQVNEYVPIVSNSYKFYRNLAYRMTNTDVKELQKYLNAQGFILAQSGAGSPDKETTYFGLLTYKAIIKFQEAHFAEILAPSGLKKGTGYFGPSTRAFVNK